MNELVVIDPQGAVRRFPLTFDELGIGREPTNQIVLDDVRVSRRHARVYRGEKGHYIEDLGSANGVVLDGALIRSASLISVGMKIEVGGFVITVVPQGTPANSLGRNVGKLKCLSGELAGKEFVIGDGRVTVGRVDANQIVIDDPSVSRHHARIQRENNKWVLYDLGSSNGTFVGGRPIQQKELKDNDKIMFGSIAFRFFAPGQGAVQQGLPSPVIYAIAAGVVLIALAIALALVLRPRPGGAGDPAVIEREVSEAVQLARAAMQREDWETANKQYNRVLVKDPQNTEARTKLKLAEEFAVHRQMLATAQDLFQRNDKVGAIKSLLRVPTTSVYAERAQKLAVQISEAQRAESKGVKKDLKLTADEESALRSRYGTPGSFAAVIMYLKGDFETALNSLAKLQRKEANANAIAKDIRSVRVKQADGAVASQAADGVEKALKEWEEALRLDLTIAPESVRSQPRADIRRMMGDSLYRAGYHKFIRGDYAEAFAYWKRGAERSPENVDILQGFMRLENIAERLLQETDRIAQADKTKACQKLTEVVGLTLDTAEVNAKARAKILELCR
ncbi:MAG: FHA domain-containing protein [Deltaproteobacteria bacterium]|nr:FHA domain-containing protein [Deltaproteobacteria bacterium]